MKSKTRSIKSLSLFSGAMGLDLGLEAAGIQTIGCIELDNASIETIHKNKPSLPVLKGDISKLTASEILKGCAIKKRDIDIVVGGPPCQAFSVIGKRRGVIDERGRLVFDFARIVGELRPKAFIMENVRGLHSMSIGKKGKGSLYEKLVQQFNDIGYTVDTFFVNAVNYGAPQIRERVIIFGNRLGRKATFPKPTHSDTPINGQKEFVTLGQAILNISDLDTSIMDFSPRKKRYLELVPPGGNWRSMPVEIQKESMGKTWYLKGGRSAHWRRLSFDSPSPTVVTMPNHASTSMCHPTETRALTIGECSAIQQFPATWKFCGTPMEQYRQVGNAVPIVLGTMAGIAVMEVLTKQAPRRGNIGYHTMEHIRPHVRTRQYFKAGEVFVDSPYRGGRRENVTRIAITI